MSAKTTKYCVYCVHVIVFSGNPPCCNCENASNFEYNPINNSDSRIDGET